MGRSSIGKSFNQKKKKILEKIIKLRQLQYRGLIIICLIANGIRKYLIMRLFKLVGISDYSLMAMVQES